MRIAAITLLLGMCFTVHAQHLYDHQWMLGGTFDHPDDTKWNDVPILDFRADTLMLYEKLMFEELDTLTIDSFNKYHFIDRVQSYSSSDGELQFATNYCSLWSFQDTFYVENGRNIIDPNFPLCPGGSKTYEYHLLLPSNNQSAIAYYFTVDGTGPSPQGSHANNILLYELENSNEKLRVLPIDTFRFDSMYYAGLGAVKHANNRDWWIAKPMKFSTDLLLLHFDMATGQIVDTLVHKDALPYGEVGVGQFTSVLYGI